MVEIKFEVEPSNLDVFLAGAKSLPARLKGEWNMERWDKLNEFLGELPDTLAIQQMYKWQTGCSFNSRVPVPGPWRAFNGSLTLQEKGELTSSLSRLEGVKDLGALRKMTADDLVEINGIGDSRAFYLYRIFKKIKN